MAYSKIILNGETLMDVTQDTVDSGNLLSGETATKNSGVKVTGSIASKSSSDLTVSGATVTASAGYYPSNASKSVATGTATAPTSISGTSATVSTGTNTLTLSKTVSNTPRITTAGYISSGTAGNSSVSLTANVTTKAAATITPSTSEQTIASGTYLTGTQTISAMPSGTAGTPTATKGPVSNHSVSVTPSVTNTTGYITGSTKTGTAVSVSASELVSGTKSITSNGTGIDVTNYANVDVAVPSSGGETASKKQINFIDYDGTILHSYTASEWTSVTALPSNPSHSGLVAQGWNWTKAQIDAQLTEMPDGDVWVGQMYVTTSGDTEIDVHFEDSTRLSPYLSCAVSGTITIDWGDNSTSTLTGTSLTSRQSIQHIYASTGDYTITIHVESGSWAFFGTSTYYLLNNNSSTATNNKVYSNCVQTIRIGTDTSIGAAAFQSCSSLASVTIPSGVRSIGASAFTDCYSISSVTIPSGVTSIGTLFSNCYSLASVTIPSGVTSIGNFAFSKCSSLASVTIPSSVRSIGTYVFQTCSSLASVTIPSGVTSINTYVFSTCYSLTSVTIPSNVTSIGTYAFQSCSSLASVTIPSGVTSIGNSAFSNCYSLASVTIPSGVTSIGNSAFSNCYGVAEYHIKSTTPPTLGTTIFNNIQSDCIIYVPSASLSAYQSDTNWSTYTSYMVGE